MDNNYSDFGHLDRDGSRKMIEIKIDTENAAFREGNKWGEIHAIVSSALFNLKHNGFELPVTLRDINGNVVGSVIEK